jgi:GNAT superfamily N-acetyltransferase
MSEFSIRPLKRNDWPAIEALFGPKGACGGCWCMTWRRASGPDYAANQGASNKRAFKRLVTSGRATGLLAFADGAAIGWCSVAPRSEFTRIESSPTLRVAAPAGTWVVSCFYIPSAWRGRGLGSALLAAAVEYARRKRAKALDGYPVAPKRGAPLAAAFAWTGVQSMFEGAGFRDVTPPGQKRRVYRRMFRAR